MLLQRSHWIFLGDELTENFRTSERHLIVRIVSPNNPIPSDPGNVTVNGLSVGKLTQHNHPFGRIPYILPRYS